MNQAYKLIFESSPVAGILTDSTGKILLANEKAEKLLGYDETLVGKSIATIIPENYNCDHPECAVIRKNGTTFPAEISVVKFESEGIQHVFHTITDISETRQLIADLKERVKEQRTLLQVTELLFKTENPIDVFLESVNFIREGWQYPEHTDVCIKLHDGTTFSTPGFKETHWQLTSVIQLDSKPYGVITVCYNTEFPLHGDSVFLKEEKNLIDALAKLFSIFLHQWHTLKKLRESEALVNKVTALSPVNTYQFELDENGKVHFLFASRGISFSNIRFSAEEILADSEKLLCHIHIDDRGSFDAELIAAHNTGGEINVQYRVVIGDRVSWRWLRATAEMSDDGRMIWYGSTQDITQMIEYIDVLEQILFDISHVMRKPVSTMLGLTDYLVVNDNMSENTLKDFAKHLKTVAAEMDDYLKNLSEAYHQKRLSITTSNGTSFSQLLELSKKLK